MQQIKKLILKSNYDVCKNIDKVKKNFTVDYAKDRFETVHNFALETTERFFSKGIDTLEKWQDATGSQDQKRFKNRLNSRQGLDLS